MSHSYTRRHFVLQSRSCFSFFFFSCSGFVVFIFAVVVPFVVPYCSFPYNLLFFLCICGLFWSFPQIFLHSRYFFLIVFISIAFALSCLLRHLSHITFLFSSIFFALKTFSSTFLLLPSLVSLLTLFGSFDVSVIAVDVLVCRVLIRESWLKNLPKLDDFPDLEADSAYPLPNHYGRVRISEVFAWLCKVKKVRRVLLLSLY